MFMGRPSIDTTRYRLSVPNADTSTLEWLKAQLNISASIRVLIREDIQQNGFTDVTCRTVEQGPKRGRPSNAELERRQVVNDNMDKDSGSQKVSDKVDSKKEVVSDSGNGQSVGGKQPSVGNGDIMSMINAGGSVSKGTDENRVFKNDMLGSMFE